MKLYNKIGIIFLVAFVLLTASFGSYVYIQKTEHLQQVQKRYMQTARIVLKHFREARKNREKPNFNDEEFLSIVRSNNFERVDHEKISTIRKEAKRVIQRLIGRANNTKVEVLRDHGIFYLFIKHKRFRLMFVDQESVRFPIGILGTYLFSLLFLVALYLWLIRSLKPLKVLHEKILTVEQGDLSVSFKTEHKDEIAQVSNAFDDALRKIESLLESRQLFLRTIMHELKTPIGKGRLLNEFLKDGNRKEQYEAVFERLELLIEEFSKIEQMLSSSYELKLNNYNVQEMLDQALELMILEEEEIERKVKVNVIEPFILRTDFELFSLALKNLMDNALKYSPNQQVIVNIYADRIELINEGKAFMKNLEEFSQPFNSKGQGLGLGLYIVQSIMKMLKHELSYVYEDSKHLFSISPQ